MMLLMETCLGEKGKEGDKINNFEYSDIFTVAELQQIQDLFSNATGVASIITKPDGTPITKPTNFCRFCNNVIRGNEKGLMNCMKSDAALGKEYPNGPRMQPCLSGGLWDAGVSIVIGGKHLANWMIGQVRNEELDEYKIETYADQIGVDRDAYKSAFLEVPVMTTSKFREIANLLYHIANSLSERAFRNKELELLVLEQKLTEEQLRQSEEKYRLIVENQSDLVVKVDNDGKLLYVSPCYCRTFGKTESELLGHSYFPLVHPDDVESTKESMKQLSQSPYSCKVVQRAMTVDGWRWFSWSDQAVVNDQGEIESIIGVGRDITESKLADQRLEASEEKYRNLIENSMVGVIQGKENWNEIFANNAALKMFEVDSIDELKLHIHSKLFAILRDKETILRHLKEEGHVENYELAISTKKGNEKYILISLTMLENQIDGTFIDITERKLTEREIKLKNEQLRSSNAEKDKFFSIIAHDLRSPFNSFLGLTHIMAEDLDNMTLDQIQKVAVSMKNSAGNVNRLLENLLNWAKTKRGLIQFQPKLYKVNEFMGHCSDSCSETARNKSIDISFDFPSDIQVYADINMLQTILRNLVSNSVKFTNPGGKVIVSARKDKNENVIFSVKDTGIGMNKKMTENLFQIDVNTARKGTAGEPSTGLGLILCKEYIDKHGGDIWVESIECIGSTFYLSFPGKQKIMDKKSI